MKDRRASRNRGSGGLIKVRLREVESKCAQDGGKREDENPARLGRTPRKEDAHNGDECRNAERDGRQRDARCDPNAKEPSQGEGNEGHHRISGNER